MQVIRSLALGAALVLGATTIAAAQQPVDPQPPREARAHARPQGDRGPQQGRAMRRRAEGAALLRGIRLSEAQREQARVIGEKYRPQMQALMRDGRAERTPRAGRAGERQARPDSAARAQRRAQVAERMDAIRPQLQALRERQETELRAILTPEQQAAFDANRARRAERAARPTEPRRRPARVRPPA